MKFYLRPTSAQLEFRCKTPIGQDYTGFTGFLSLQNFLRPSANFFMQCNNLHSFVKIRVPQGSQRSFLAGRNSYHTNPYIRKSKRRLKMAYEKKKAETEKTVTPKATVKQATANKTVTEMTATKKPSAQDEAAKKASPPKKVTADGKTVTKKAPATTSHPTTRATPLPSPEDTSSPGTRPAPSSQSPAETEPPAAAVGSEERLVMIEEAAYYKAEKRNFAPGFEAEDWAEAEREIDEKLKKQ